MKPRQTISPKQFAAALGVSESSIKRWCDQGILSSTRTPGGHRRIPIEAAIDFARQSDRSIARPELLGMPAALRLTSLKDLLPVFTRDLLDGKEQSVREMAYDMFVRHLSLANVFDEVICPALETVGRGCGDGSVKLYEERRACAIISGVLAELRAKIAPTEEGPVACGGTMDTETHGLGTQMVEIVLRDQGWRAISMGSDCPIDAFIEAAEGIHPDAMWLSTSYQSDPGDFSKKMIQLVEALSSKNIPLFVGGSAADSIASVPLGATVVTSLPSFVEHIAAMHPQRRHSG